MITKPSTNLTLKVQLEEMLLVGLGAVPGALLRWLASAYFADQNLLVNLGGALLLGFWQAPQRLQDVNCCLEWGSVALSLHSAAGCCLR